MKMSATAPQTIDEYIADFPAEVQALLQKVRATIKKAAPAAEEAISYQIPTFKLKGNLVHFAAYKKHIGFYPAASGIAHFQAELAGFKTSRGAVQFPLDKPIPYSLITQIVKFRAVENLEKAMAKQAKKK